MQNDNVLGQQAENEPSSTRSDRPVPLLNYFHFSPAGQDFMNLLLTTDPGMLPSAEALLQHPWFTDESLRATNEDGADVSPQGTLDPDRFQDTRRALIIGDGHDPNSMSPLMEDDNGETGSRGEPISLEGLVLTDNVETQVGGAASEQARDAEIEARIHEELEARVLAENQPVQQAPAEQATGIRAAAGAPRMAETDTDNDESDLEDASTVGAPSASGSGRANPSTWLNLKSLPDSILDIEFDITADYYRIGGVAAPNQIVIAAERVSARHCTFRRVLIKTDRNPYGYFKVSLHPDCRNGIWVNKKWVIKGTSIFIKHEDRIEFFRDDEGGSLLMSVDMESP